MKQNVTEKIKGKTRMDVSTLKIKKFSQDTDQKLYEFIRNLLELTEIKKSANYL